ncbi:hypothetical protein ACFQ15_01360 [Sphingomonas hankookensis]|uniref:hypothetical protein n=1 Tax=Sphingomonas hankookensis TaxID=563996 RepID=UPI001F5810CF|nr:hypothetical protein [Sphingomonas hankookensis]
MKRGIWATLDLDPTTDRTAIRRAYAARLKAMDVDADPDAFEALRDARDAALARAADPVAQVAVEPMMADDLPPPPVAPEPQPEPDPLAEAMNAHFHALEALLFPGHDAPPTADELAEIDHHGRALLADPRLEQLDFAAGAERWFAETLSASVPRSDPLLEPAAATFGWIDRRDDYALSAEAHAVVERIGATRFAALVSDPKHRFHRAWREVTRTDTGRAEWLVTGRAVRNLLSAVRGRYPLAEEWLNPARVAKWDKPAGSPNGTYWWIAIVIVVTVLRFALSGTHYPDTPPAVHATSEEIAQAMTGRGIDEVRRANPALAQAIAQAATDFSAGTTASYIGQQLTDEWVRHGLSSLPDPILLQLTRWDVDQMRAAQRVSPVPCENVNLMRPGLAMVSTIGDRRQELLRAVVLYARDRPLTDTTYTFAIPTAIVDDMAARTKLPTITIERALQGKETSATRCAVQIALRDSALRAPTTVGRPLLRDLQPLLVHDRTKADKAGG